MSTDVKYWTWDEIWAALQSQLDLENETFIDEDEMMLYANDAIEECEDHIQTLNEEYFLSMQPIVLTTIDEVALPDSIYAFKFRGLVYKDASKYYEIKRIWTLNKFLKYRAARNNNETADTVNLRYFIVNISAGAPRIMLTPPPNGGTIEAWFYRNANRLEDGDDVCDLPQCIRYVFDYCHERFHNKRAAGSPRHTVAIQRLAKTEERMLKKLAGAQVDGDEDLEADPSHYEDHE